LTVRRVAGLVLALIALANFGNFYVYDSIGPVADLLIRQRGFSDTQIGLLNALYSLPNVVVLLFGGLLVDRLGAARMMLWTGAICFAGAALTALGSEFQVMAAGRLLFGIGAETFNICTLTAIVKYFSGRNLAFAIAFSIAVGRAGAFAVDLSPVWMARAYADGWQPPLIVAALFAGLSLAMAACYWWIDRRQPAATAPASAEPVPRVSIRDITGFIPAYWRLLALGALWYAVIFAFRSTFSIKYFQHAHGLDLAAAGAINGYVFLAALFATPALGWLCDRVGHYASFLATGAFFLPIAIASMALTQLPLWIGTVLIGVSFSLVPAVLWPLTARLVPESRLGTALGLMWIAQNAAIACANVMAGWLNDRFGASAANPGGYGPMMFFFFAAGSIGFGLALALWRSATGTIAAPFHRGNRRSPG
jgi:MFS family permease